MAEYISKQSIIDYLNGYLHSIGEGGADSLLFDRGQRRALINSIQDISAVEAADVQPVKRGKWEQDEKGAFHHCSECESKTFRDVDGWGYEYQEYLTDYCFRCGARMDAEPDEPWQSE